MHHITNFHRQMSPLLFSRAAPFTYNKKSILYQKLSLIETFKFDFLFCNLSLMTYGGIRCYELYNVHQVMHIQRARDYQNLNETPSDVQTCASMVAIKTFTKINMLALIVKTKFLHKIQLDLSNEFFLKNCNNLLQEKAKVYPNNNLNIYQFTLSFNHHLNSYIHFHSFNLLNLSHIHFRS
ncbi:hypothetical protein O6H91_03G019500 [Diphasiastrum complanatum]|uniref:Uncharacterized protein n=1 Tax=Diphasiastrum complanatum TaxID=34168 RepID=A0ACC2E437_DIPCM|nr:hypothetical protein O6H91_03G019500 [Diphasiastrum complanatum]